MSNTTSLQKYDVSIEDLDEQIDTIKNNKIGGRYGNRYKFPEGKTVVRVAPPRPGATVKSPFLIVNEHFINVPGTNGVSFVCPRAQGNGEQKCPVCEKALRLLGTNNPKDEEAAQKLRPEARAYCAILVRGQEAMGWQITHFSAGSHKKLVAILKEPDPADGGNFSHPVTGFDIVVTRTGKDLSTRYDVKARTGSRGPILEDPDELDELLNNIPNLAPFAKIPTMAEIEAKLRGERQLPSGRRAEDYTNDE